MNTSRLSTPRLLAGFGTAALIGAVCLVSSRPAHTAGGPIAVSVANTPIATTAADDPAKQPFQKTLEIQANNSFPIVATVPAGKRLVIESICAYSVLPNDTSAYTVYVFSTGSNSGFQAVDLSTSAAPSPAVTQKMLLYIEARAFLQVDVLTSGSTTPDLFVTLTGHYVDVP